MRKKTRRLIFGLAVGLFLIISCAVVLFALGYKYDFVQNKLLKTGSFGIKSNVNAKVYINDGLAGTTSFLTNSFSKGRLLPRSYRVRIERNKYQAWQKLITVQAGGFTDFPRVVLVPDNLDKSVLATSSFTRVTFVEFNPTQKVVVLGNGRIKEARDLSSGQRLKAAPTPLVTPRLLASSVAGPAAIADNISKIISPDNNKKAWFADHEIWVEWLNNSGYQPYHNEGETTLITRFSGQISDIQWYKDSEHLIVNVSGALKFLELDDRGGINIFDLASISGPFYYDRDQDAIYKMDGNKLIRLDLK